jgi:PAS domain S-box-containing protein
MDDDKKTKKQLIGELKELRQCVAELKGFEEEIKKTRENHDKFTKAFLQNSIPAGITTLKEGRFVDVSDAFLRVMGRKRDEVVGHTSTEIGFITVEQRASFFNELNKRGRVENLEMIVRTKGGTLRHGLFNAVMMSLKNEKYLLTVMIDITERKLAEEALRTSEKRHDFLIRNTSDYVARYSLTGILLFGSDAMISMTGFKPEELKGTSGFDRVHPDDRSRVQAALKEAIQTDVKQNVEYRTYSKDGVYRWVEMSGKTVQNDETGQLEIVAVVRDITERKLAEEAIRTAEETYRNIFLNSQVGLFRTDIHTGQLLDANDVVARFIGYQDRASLLAEPFNISERYVDPYDREKMISLLLAHGEFQNYEARFRKNDGSIILMCFSAKYVREKGWMEGVSEDITDRKRAEEALARAAQEWQGTFDATNDAIWILDQDQRVLRSNKTAEQIFHRPCGEIVGKHCWEIVHGTAQPIPECPILRVQKSLHREKMELQIGEHCFEVIADPILDAAGRYSGAVHIVRDVTERNQADEKIHASLREKEILLNEIHHRVKNNMQVISSLLKLQASACKNPELTERLNESQSRIHAMALVHEKLYNSKDFTRIDLAGYVRTLSQELFLSFKMGPGEIDLIVQTDGDVYVDINKAIPCGLILNELISNTLKHAFPGGRQGELQILLRETENTEIEIVVRDNGLGLPDDVDIHAPRSLGLDLVNGLVTKQLDGQIEVKRDKGTEFRITFPL